MIIGDRLREMREEKKLSQGDIEKRTGLLRCYISRVENGHTVPAIETLEKMARALECPLYQLFYEGEDPPKLPHLLKRKSSDEILWAAQARKHVISTSFAVSWARLRNQIGSCSYTWHKKWPIGSLAICPWLTHSSSTQRRCRLTSGLRNNSPSLVVSAALHNADFEDTWPMCGNIHHRAAHANHNRHGATPHPSKPA
jgi:transcriptional regulator with XRE-family HTH domain